jgi:4-amino-4-deoxy-L-arabinose transferase-like glycosyltransferase
MMNSAIHPAIRSSHHWLTRLLALFFILGVSYAAITPPFEPPDESSHLQVIHYIAQEHHLYAPVTPALRVMTGSDMATVLRPHIPPRYYTPPLYHILAAIVTSGIEMRDLSSRLIPNPVWDMGWAPQRNTDPWNKNFYVHLPGETLTESPTVRATILLRLCSLGLSIVTIICTYHIAHDIHPERPAFALGAAAFVALNPQFIFLSASVTNDPLLSAIFSLTLLLALRFMRTAANWGHWTALGALVGIGMLTKQSALLLLPLGGLAILGQKRPHSALPWKKILIDGFTFGLAAFIVCGGWYLLNMLNYDDPLGLQVHFGSAVPLRSFGFRQIRAIFETYWAGFGRALISAPTWVYWIISGVVGISCLGSLRSTLPNGNLQRLSPMSRRSLGILTVALVLNTISMVRWAIATGASFGRLLFPGIAATSILLAWGLDQWHRTAGFRIGMVVLTVLAITLATLTPWLLLKPAYASPLYTRALPQKATSANIAFDNGITLLGYEIQNHDLYPGDILPVSLYWRAISTPVQRYTVWIQLSPQDPTQRITEGDRWLGGTLYPSDFWRAGDTIRQKHQLQLPDETLTPGLYWIRLGLVDETGARITFADGNNMVSLGPWRVRTRSAIAKPTHHTQYFLGNDITLKGYDITALDASVIVTLTWTAKTPPPQDYSVFIHLMDENGDVIAQHDGPPVGGCYPTSWWLPGDSVTDPHILPLTVPLAANTVQLRVGMYDQITLTRLPAYNEKHLRLTDDIIVISLLPNP